MKKLLSIALCLILALSLLPTAALAAPAASVWVNGVELTGATPYLASNMKGAGPDVAQTSAPASGGYAYFNKDEGKLTLHDYSNTGAGAQDVYTSGAAGNHDLWAAIYADGDLTLVLEGDSTVYTKDGSISPENPTDGVFAARSACVYVTGALTISENGSGSALLRAGSSYYAGAAYNYGVCAGSLTVSGGTVTVDPSLNGAAKAVKSTSTDPTNKTATAYGIYSAGDISFNGGTVTAKSVSSADGNSNNSFTDACGVYSNGSITVAAGASVTAGNCRNTSTYFRVVYGLCAADTVTVSGTVNAVGAADSKECYGIYGVNRVTIKDAAQVTAEARSIGSFNGGGIFGENVEFADSASITAATAGINDSYAVSASSALTVKPGAEILGGQLSGNTITQTTTGVSTPVTIECSPTPKITFDTANGQASAKLVAADLSALPTPEWKDYTFAGWYTQRDGGDGSGTPLTLEAAQALTDSATYYAAWENGDKFVRTTPLTLGYVTDGNPAQGWRYTYNNGFVGLELTGATIDTGEAVAVRIDAGTASISLTLTGDNTITSYCSGGADSYGILTGGKMTIRKVAAAGSLTAAGGAGSSKSCGIQAASLSITAGVSVTATGGAATSSYGVYCTGGGLTITDSSLTAAGGTAGGVEVGSSYGAYLSRGNFSNAGGVVSLTGGAAVYTSYGLLATLDTNSDPTGGDVTSNGGITAVSDSGALHHAALTCAGVMTLGGENDIRGSTISRDNNYETIITVYTDDSYRLAKTDTNVDFFGAVGDRIPGAKALTVKAGATLTLEAGSKLCVTNTPALETGSGDKEAGKLVNNGLLVSAGWLARDVEQGITGYGVIQLGTGTGVPYYHNDGAQFTKVVSDLDLTSGDHSYKTLENDGYSYGKPSEYANYVLTLAADTLVAGNVLLPGGMHHVSLGDRAVVLGKLTYSTTGSSDYLDIISDGESVIGSVDAVNTGSSPIRLGFYGVGTLNVSGLVSASGMNAEIGENMTVNIGSANEDRVGGLSLDGGELMVSGTLIVHALRGGILAPHAFIGAAGSVTAGCTVGMELHPAAGSKALIIEAGGTFAANARAMALLIVDDATGSENRVLGDLVSLPSYYIPSGISWRSADINEAFNPRGKLYTLAADGSTATDVSNNTYLYAVSGAASSVELKQYQIPSGNTYALTFETNGGSALSKLSKFGGTTIDLSDYQPTRAGFAFAGWYSDAELTQKIVSVKLSGNTTVYAKWALAFTDVPEGKYYYDAVVWAVTGGVTEGMSGTTFSPDDICTRAQMVTFLWRAMGSPEPVSATCQFTDVASDAYYYKAVLWAAEKGVTEGTGDGTTFSPNDTVTRAQVVTLQWRAAGKPAVQTENPFDDVVSGAYYESAVLWAVEQNITEGTGAAAFSPDDACTRAEIVTFLYRHLAK